MSFKILFAIQGPDFFFCRHRILLEQSLEITYVESISMHAMQN